MRGSAATFRPTCFMATRRGSAGKSRAARHLQGDLFVGGPLGVEAEFLGPAGQGAHDLGRRRARVSRGHVQPRLDRPAGDGLVSHQQFAQGLMSFP